MSKRTLYLLLSFVLIATIFTACKKPVTPTVQPTPMPSATPRPTSTPIPPRPVIPYTPVPADQLSPIVVDRVPHRGEELAPDGVVRIAFDKRMDTASVENAFRVQVAGDKTALIGTFTWIDDRVVEFVPETDLPRETVYDVILTQDAQAEAGEMLREPFTFRFATAGYLEVTQVIPADGTVDVEADSTITVMFNKPVVPLTNLDAMDDFPVPIEITPELVGEGEWLNTSIYVFKPDASLSGGTQYKVTVKAGLEDVTGAILDDDFTWHFTTIPPRVTWTTPSEDEQLVPIDSTIRVTFNQPIDPASAAESFSIKADGRNEVHGDYQFDGHTMTFTPHQMLDFDTTYECQIEAGVTSVSGGVGMPSAHSWEFNTVPLPRIVATYPKNGERAASPYTNFRIEFNTPINPDTVMPNLTMTPPITPTEVYTYFSSWDNTFVLSFGAQPSTDYVVEIDNGIADPYGNTIPQGRTVSFTTDSLPPYYRLHTPDSIGTYDATKAAQLVVGYVNLSKIDFSLYSVPESALEQPYWNWKDERPTGSTLIREWRETFSAQENQQSYAVINMSDRSDGTLKPGVYLLEADSPDLPRDEYQRRQVHMLVVSELNMTLKVSEDNLLVWITDLTNGAPVANLNLTVREIYNERTLDQITTDKDGVAMLDLDGHNDNLMITSSTPFGAVSEGWERGISPWDFGVGEGLYSDDYQTHIYTDRPIYRAGQTVHFKGVVRAEDDALFSMPDVSIVSISIRDAAWEEIYVNEFQLSAMGTFEGSIELSENATLGDYSISVNFRNNYNEIRFQVAQYRPPEFELTVDPSPDAVLRGGDVDATIQASYYFGGPLSDLDISWNVTAQSYTFSPSWGGRYSFDDPEDPFYRCWWCWWDPPVPPTAILSGSGTTDSDGTLPITVKGDDLDSSLGKGAQLITIEGVATGPDNQAIAGRSSAIVHPGSYYIGLAPQTYVGKAGDESLIDVVAVDWDSQRLASTEIKLSLYRYEWINTFVENDFGGGSWEWETREVFIESVEVKTDELGEAVASLKPPTGGSYRVIASPANPGVETEYIRTSIFIWVSGEDTISWRRENHDRINLISDKQTYQVGDTAEILIPSPFEGPQTALITVERGSVRRYEVVDFSSNSLVYQLPITADDVPNIYVSVVLVQGSEYSEFADYKMGMLPLSVDLAPRTLNITMDDLPDTVEPGDELEIDISATNPDGSPAANAELSLDLVDKAVLSLSPRNSDILHTLYATRALQVRTSTTLNLSVNLFMEDISEELEDLLLEQTTVTDGAAVYDEAEEEAPMGMGGGPAMEGAEMPRAATNKSADTASTMAGIEVREDFADTAYWAPAVTTDGQGKATISLTLPDNTTTWVIRGVGLTKDTVVGETTEELVASKFLIIRPVTPRFLVVDDRAQFAANIINNTDTPLDLTVLLEGKGYELDKDTPAEQTFTIGAQQETKATWWVTALDVAVVDVTFKASATLQGRSEPVYTDASKPRLTTGPEGTLLVYRYTAPDIVGTAGQLIEGGARTEAIALPLNVDTTRGELRIQLDPSLAAGMVEGLDYLEHFPYECTEQTVSRFLPNVLTYRAMNELGIENPELEAKLPALIEEGLGKLYAQQNPDGGWGWWHDVRNPRSNSHISAYVVFALLKTQEAGFIVDVGVLNYGLNYLEGQLKEINTYESTREANHQAWLLYVLAEANMAPTDKLDTLFEYRDKLSHYGRAYLAQSLWLTNPKDSRLETLLSDLNNAAILSATGAHWEETEYDWWAMNTDTRSTAIILDALAKLDPENALNPNVVRWLMVARSTGIWETTQETAWALISLTDWMRYTGELDANYDFAAFLNDVELDGGSAIRETIQESTKISVPIVDLLQDATNTLTLARTDGNGRLYYTAHLEVYMPVEDIEPVNRGFSISRRYTQASCAAERITAGGSVNECPEVTEVEFGDVIRVDLTISTPHDRYYVVVEDPLPAGGEAIDTGLATTSLLAMDPTLQRTESRYWWWWQWYSRSEMRDEKVILFAEVLSAGTYEYSYTFRATLPGEYHVIPTVATEFYFPEVFGRSDGRLLTIEQ